jgi:hypothetical protein
MSLSSTSVRFTGIPEIQQNLIKAALCYKEARSLNQTNAPGEARRYQTTGDTFIHSAVADEAFPDYIENASEYNKEPVLVSLSTVFRNKDRQDLSLQEVFDPENDANQNLKPYDLYRVAHKVASDIVLEVRAQKPAYPERDSWLSFGEALEKLPLIDSPFMRSLLPLPEEAYSPWRQQ